MSKSAKIAALNDQFRKTGQGGRYMITAGVKALGDQAVMEIVAKVKSFSDFNKNNDPHHEHDMGKMEHNGETIFWKIDYYDKAMQYGSDDPSDQNKTTRVLTILLADEY